MSHEWDKCPRGTLEQPVENIMKRIRPHATLTLDIKDLKVEMILVRCTGYASLRSAHRILAPRNPQPTADLRGLCSTSRYRDGAIRCVVFVVVRKPCKRPGRPSTGDIVVHECTHAGELICDFARRRLKGDLCEFRAAITETLVRAWRTWEANMFDGPIPWFYPTRVAQYIKGLGVPSEQPEKIS